MTRGALIFAFNNEQIDYLAMAAWSADNIHRHLDIPVCVITDSDIDDRRFDRVIRVDRTPTDQQRQFADVDGRVTWYNQDRIDAYRLSPWNQTLVLDADYVVASDQLVAVLDSHQTFLCHRKAWDMVTGLPLDNLNNFGRHRMPMWWATVMMFRRDHVTSYIFDCMRMVRDHWSHYSNLYGLGRSHYRNDFALSIALGIVTGHTLKIDAIDWNLMTLMPEHQITELEQDLYQVSFQKAGRNHLVTLKGVDFHAMGKSHLGNIVANHS